MQKYNKSKEQFEYLINTLKDTIKGVDYFVNWDKVLKNTFDIEIKLNILNTLIGKENVREVFKEILTKYPDVISVIPVILASRDKKMEILNIKNEIEIEFEIETYQFSKKDVVTDDDREKIVGFVEKTGFLELIKNKSIKNLVDYVIGVEVGLDSNARKNRSGTAMESLVEMFVKRLCDDRGYEYIDQATPKKIFEKWGKEVETDKASRRFDFAINTSNNLYLIETNYYGGGGSKLKATAGEYKYLNDLIARDGYEFIWITDGKGWLTAKKPLEETYDLTKYTMNLQMVQDGILEEIIN